MLAYVSSWPPAQEWSSALFTTSHFKNSIRSIACTFPSQFLSTRPLASSVTLHANFSLHSENMPQPHPGPESLTTSTYTFPLLCIFQSQAHPPLSLFLPCSFFHLDQIPPNMQGFPLLSKLYTVCRAYRHGQHDSLPYSALCTLVKIVLKGQVPLWGWQPQ